MKYWLSYTFSTILLSVLFSFIYYLINVNNIAISASPIPDFLMLNKNNQVTLLDMWNPVLGITDDKSDLPAIEARSALLYDPDKEEVLFGKNITERMPMASLTKIMTAIITLEDQAMPEEYYVHGEDLVGEDSMGLEDGEVLTKEELLYGLLLNSGNDAAEVLAHNYPGGREAFLTAMKNKAAALGLTNTRFSNPSGLQGDGEQYTTASDLLVLTKYALDNFPLFREAVATYEYTLSATKGHKEYILYNETNLISSYPGVKGVKTGYTPEAGMCLVTYYDKDGVRLLGILLNSPNRRTEMRSLLDYSLGRKGVALPRETL